MELEQEIQKLFIANNWTLGLAESCTGGALCSRLVQIPDCSLYLLGSIVAYANAAKIHLLHVQEKTLENWGAVSEETAREMAQGALKQFGSDFAIATTGIAGPRGGTPQKKVGTICFAIAFSSDELFSWRSQFKGERGQIIKAATTDALQHLLDHVT